MHDFWVESALKLCAEELQHVLGEQTTSEADLAQMQHQHGQLQRSVAQLEERKRQSNSNPDDSMAGFRQQANLIAKKKEAIEKREQRRAEVFAINKLLMERDEKAYHAFASARQEAKASDRNVVQ